MTSFLSEHVDRIQTAIASPEASHSALVASWRRSSSAHHLNPAEYRSPSRLTDRELQLAREASGSLLDLAQPSLDRLFQAVGAAGCSVLLADKHGVALDRRGFGADDKTFESWGLWKGAIWSEESEGTNGIGTCIVEQRTLTIHRDQHFYARNALMSCTTAPIFNHVGELAAVLDVSSCRADLVEGILGLVTIAASDAARRIEAENFKACYATARIILPATPNSSALLAVDADDLVIGANRAARHSFGIDQAIINRGVPVQHFLKELSDTASSLQNAERGAIQRALAEADGNVSAAAKTLGISRATLHRKMKRLSLSSSR